MLAFGDSPTTKPNFRARTVARLWAGVRPQRLSFLFVSKIQLIFSSRKFRLRCPVVGGMRCKSFASAVHVLCLLALFALGGACHALHVLALVLALETSLRQARDNKSRAANLLGISRPRLYRRIKDLNLGDDEPVEKTDPVTD
jgi:Bacterial regulatory protein, Fis family